MVRTENHVITPSKPLFHISYVDDIHNCLKINVPDTLFEKLIKYRHRNDFTIETDPKKFLYMEIIDILRILQKQKFTESQSSPQCFGHL